jgi:hypothetical protein
MYMCMYVRNNTAWNMYTCTDRLYDQCQISMIVSDAATCHTHFLSLDFETSPLRL